VCKGCVIGKYSKMIFSSYDNRSKGILYLVHSNVCGPVAVGSLSGFNYYVNFIDDCSRRMWIYFMKTIDEAFNQFQEFKSLVENQIRRKVRVIMLDNGG
jgi:hypothetical protein